MTAWPVTPPAPVDADPCGVYGPCETPISFCWTTTAFYKNARAEAWCQSTCYDGGC
jgi:hypothetical protein